MSYLLVAAYIKDMEEVRSCSLPACPQSQWKVHSFTGFRAYVLRVLMYAENT